MIVYIYQIINNLNNKRYIGQTSNISRRKQTHYRKLRAGTHPNPHLQAAFIKYGEENFNFTYEKFNVDTKKDKDNLEKQYIRDYNSLVNGYNLTAGGTGGFTSNANKLLDFEQYCIAYAGNTKYKGMTNETAKWLECDSSTISTIAREKSYNDFLNRFQLLPEKEKQHYLQIFEEHFNLPERKVWTKRKRLDDAFMLEILCVVSTFSKGTEQAIIRKFNFSKGLVRHTMVDNSYLEVKKQLSQMSELDITTIGIAKMQEWELLKYTPYKTLKLRFTNLFDKYKITL